MGGIRKTAGADVTAASVAALHRQYRSLDRRLRLLWWWGRTGRGVRRIGRAVLFAAALVFAVMSCGRIYGQLVHGLGALHRM
jgi:hypothetical protein